jgi:O-acetyl-ADP-ribose deacetylase (regulator of RNase III)
MPEMKVVRGDITRQNLDAIVNAANTSLMGGGGVDGAIHRAGGPAILEECKKIVARQGGCPTGSAVITTAGNLPARFVIHTAGPVWNGGRGNERELLRDCYIHSLQLAVEHECNSIGFPNISTGIYRFPKREAAEIAVKAVNDFLQTNAQPLQVVFVCHDEENFELVQKEIENLKK